VSFQHPSLYDWLTSQVTEYHRLIDETIRLLSTIHTSYISPAASRQINLLPTHRKRLSAQVKQASQIVLPDLDDIFSDAEKRAEELLASDIYPRFVKHQVTASATSALANGRERFPGLGDCFCLTDPR